MSLTRPLLVLATSAAFALPARAQTRAHLVIDGGNRSGQYDASASGTNCATGGNGKGSFAVQFSNQKTDLDRFNSVQLVVPTPFATGSNNFLLVLGFGPTKRPTLVYTIETRIGQPRAFGSGTVAVTDDGADSASVTFDVSAADGTRMTGTISCKGINRL